MIFGHILEQLVDLFFTVVGGMAYAFKISSSGDTVFSDVFENNLSSYGGFYFVLCAYSRTEAHHGNFLKIDWSDS